MLLLTAPASAAEPTTLECVRANEDGQDVRRVGKLHEAIQEFSSCAAPSCPPVVREDCVRRLDEARKAMPKLVFVARDGAGRPVPRFTIKMDSAPLETTNGEPIEVEPGEHVFEFSADGHQPTSKKLVAREGVKHDELVLFEPTKAAPPKDARAESNGGSSRRTIAYAAFGMGIIGLGVGAAFGIAASNTYASAKDKCPTPAACPRGDAIDERNTSVDQATISTVAFSIGAAALVAGIVLWLTAPAARRPEPAAAWGFRYGGSP
jgi:hypothetical protein